MEKSTKQYYKVWKVDICFDCYASEVILVGADNEEEIIKNLSVICGGRKFLKYQIKEIRKSLSSVCPRIKEIPNLWTDKKLCLLEQWGYME